VRVRIDACADHCRYQRRHLPSDTDEIARGAAARQEHGAPSAMLPAIAVAIRRAGAVPVAAIRSGNKIARRKTEGGPLCGRFPAADDGRPFCREIESTSFHAPHFTAAPDVFDNSGRVFLPAAAAHLTPAASLRDN